MNASMTDDDLRRWEAQLQDGMAMAERYRPDLVGSMGMYVAANDYASMFRAWNRFMLDKDMAVSDLLLQTGSYARMEQMVRVIAATNSLRMKDYPVGWYVKDIYPRLCELWSSSDPDDTDPRFEHLFREAYAHSTNLGPIYDVKPMSPSIGAHITVWRGEARGMNDIPDLTEVGGLSWTTDSRVARKFATGADRRGPNQIGTVFRASVNEGHVLAFITGRGESELIISPENVTLEAVTYAYYNQPKKPLDWLPLASIKPKSLTERTQPK